jgi:hypothetical protein
VTVHKLISIQQNASLWLAAGKIILPIVTEWVEMNYFFGGDHDNGR